ncbi:lysophospholipid acyltransferase family protein [Humibacter albus]|uniref:lysophospholipid acyltransferase family protein n=1 Tax=Humibacter albus TaxID=427754 RepID=UPI0004223441
MPKTPDDPDASASPPTPPAGTDASAPLEEVKPAPDRSVAPVKKRRSGRETTRPSVFWPMAGIVVPLIGTFARFKVHGRENLPKTGAYIIAPNHYSEIDPLVVGSMIWRRGRAPRFLAKESLFAVPVVGWFLTKSGQVPVSRSHGGRGAPIAQAQHIVDDGSVVIVYPEGTLTRDPDLWPMRGKTGAARLALNYGIPVIPLAHWGTQQIMARYSKKISLFPRKTITFSIGEPVDLDEFRGKPLTASVLAEATERIMQGVTRELEKLRGEKGPAERWDPAAHAQSETGRFEG